MTEKGDLRLEFIPGREVVVKWAKGWKLQGDGAAGGFSGSVPIEMLKAVRAYMSKVIGAQFSRLRRGGGDRGVTWADFAPQYVRKDGTAVPAWGGVQRADGQGNVKPRRRPSGRYLTPQSNLMQDTGRLRAERTMISYLSWHEIRFGPTVKYAARQHAMRPFAFFQVPKDLTGARDEAFITFRQLMAKSGGRGQVQGA